jgi:hypothetical protein
MKCNENMDFETDTMEPNGELECPSCKYKIGLFWNVKKGKNSPYVKERKKYEI